jgi:photosystem II stability/assembly factor-like uncharacterized protein
MIGLPLCLAALSSAQSTLHLRVSGPGPARDLANQVLAGLGSITGKDSSGAFIVKLNKGLRADRVAEHLRLKREVAAAWIGGQPTSWRLTSLFDITNYIEEKESQLDDDKDMDAKERHEEKEKLGLDYLEAYQHFTKIRAFPYDKINWDAYDKARIKANSLPPARIGVDPNSKAPLPLGGKWEFVGPKNLDVPYRIYYGVRPTSGRVNAIAYDPTNTRIIYLGAAGGGVWKSTDAGVNWVPLSDSWDFLNVSSIAVHPTNGKILYVGTGDWHGGGGYGMGIMKSTDGGLTWTNLGRTQFQNNAISKILIDPETPENLVITLGRGRAGNGQVFRSTNGGSSWTSVITTAAPWSDATFSGKNSSGVRNYYVVGGGTGGNVYRSQDKGATWTKLNPGVSTGYLDNLAIAASPTNPENAYLLSPGDQKIFKTTDHGGSWTDTTGNFPGGYNWSQGWYDFHIACSSSGTTDTVYVGLIDIIRSTDNGANWKSAGVTYTDGALTHNDQQSIAINPQNASEVMFGNDGGIFKLVGSTITPLSKTLGISQFYHGDWHPTNPSIMIGGTQDNATPTSLGDLANWRNFGGGDGGWAAINPINPANQYATSQFLGVYRTNNSWGTSEYIGPNAGADALAFVPTIAIDPSKPTNLYAGTNYLWRYNASSNSWSPRLGGTRLSSTGVVIAIAVSPKNSQVIYTGASDGNFYMTSNGGAAWRKLNGLPQRAITSISVDPKNDYSVIVTVSGTGTGHLYQCTNTNATTPVFTNRSGSGGVALPDIPTNSVDRDPAKGATNWFVGTDIGVFATTDGGISWQNATAPLGLPNVPVNAIKAIPGTGYLNVATFGRGMWRIKLGTEQNLAPISYSLMGGSLVQGTTLSLAAVDGNVMKVKSANQSGIGQVAGILNNFTTSTPRANILGVEIFVRSSGQSLATEQVFVKNQTTGVFEVLQNSASSTSLRDLRFTLAGNATNYVSSAGKIEVVVRAIKPTHLGTTAITYTVDCVNVILRSAG